MAAAIPEGEIPRGDLAGFKKYFKQDLLSGFFVFLIALPLCLGISIASGFPPIAGIFTAIVGSIVTTFLSNSELTIKGPAAGLIVIVIGAVTSFGFTGGQDPAADQAAYKMALAVGVVAGVIQVIFGLVRAGKLGDFFPTSAVHGMLASIGVIIMLKQIPVAVGQTAKGEPLELLRQIPEKLANANPEIAIIGLVSLIILFGLPLLKKAINNRYFNMIPAQMVVLLVAVPMGIYFNLAEEHTYSWGGHNYLLNDKLLVTVPNNLLAAMAHPDFSVFTNPDLRMKAIGWVVMFTLIGSLESMLSAKAVDMIDPYKRKTNLNRDLVAVGIANTAVACIGGLPMISEIVRSKANADNGAKTRFADMWHGVFLLGFVALAPGLIHKIPLAALAAMLVYTGFRLASPREFINVYKIGPEQLLIFTSTIIGVLATDLLIGIGIGIAVKAAIHVVNGVPLTTMFKPYLEVLPQGEDSVLIVARGSAVFTNWLSFKREIEQIGLQQRNNVTIDLSGTKLVDHSVMEKLHEMEGDFQQAGLHFEVTGLEAHQKVSSHPFAARKRGTGALRRITIVAEEHLEHWLEQELTAAGARQLVSVHCHAALDAGEIRNSQVRVEAIVPREESDAVLANLRSKLAANCALTVFVDEVQVAKIANFDLAGETKPAHS